MAGVLSSRSSIEILELLHQHIQQQTTVISELREQVKRLELALAKLDNKCHDCDDKPVRESGYVNWDASHESLKDMAWINLQSLTTTLSWRKYSEIIIDENTRFPEDDIYVNVIPEILHDILYHKGRNKKDLLVTSIKNHGYACATRRSFEEKYKLTWVNPKTNTPCKKTEPLNSTPTCSNCDRGQSKQEKVKTKGNTTTAYFKNNNVLKKYRREPATHNNSFILYQNAILTYDDSKDSTRTLTIQEDLSEDQYTTARQLIQGFVKNLNVKDLALDIKRKFPRRNHGALVDLILDEALTSQHTTILSNAMFLFVETNIVTLEVFKAAVKEIFCTLHLMYKEIPFPELYEKFSCILAPHIENHNITLADILIMSNDIIKVKESHHFLGTLMLTLKERKGEKFVKTLWVDSKLSPVQWMNTKMVPKWVADYKLAFLDPLLYV